MEKLIRYLRFIREAERLKNVLRTAYTSEGRHESTAEHSWRLALLAAVLTGERPELDMQRVVLMCLIHDLGEARNKFRLVSRFSLSLKSETKSVMEKLIRYLRFIREAERLKNVLRTAYTSEGRHESTAEHSWRLALLAAVLTGERPELDMQRVVLMCLIHDLGEAFDGDVPAIAQTAPGVKAASELAAMERLTRLLPPEAGATIREIWEEYEACQTPEARWVKALDKAETIIQHNQGANPAGFDYAFNLTYGSEYFDDGALLSDLRLLLDEETGRHVRR